MWFPPSKPRGGFVTYVSIILDNILAVHRLKILKRKGDDTLMLAMPTRERMDGTHEDIFHPISAIARKEFEQQIFSSWAERCKQKPTSQPTEHAEVK